MTSSLNFAASARARASQRKSQALLRYPMVVQSFPAKSLLSNKASHGFGMDFRCIVNMQPDHACANMYTTSMRL
jgi:hypothetical protein